jgi:hypothetical protein
MSPYRGRILRALRHAVCRQKSRNDASPGGRCTRAAMFPSPACKARNRPCPNGPIRPIMTLASNVKGGDAWPKSAKSIPDP